MMAIVAFEPAHCGTWVSKYCPVRSLSDASEAPLPEDRRLVHENEQSVKKTYQVYLHLIEALGAENHEISCP